MKWSLRLMVRGTIPRLYLWYYSHIWKPAKEGKPDWLLHWFHDSFAHSFMSLHYTLVSVKVCWRNKTCFWPTKIYGPGDQSTCLRSEKRTKIAFQESSNDNGRWGLFPSPYPSSFPYLALMGWDPSLGPRALPFPGEFFLANAGDIEVVLWGTWKETRIQKYFP